jgi:tetratricopeptide (TPR) repeat protein
MNPNQPLRRSNLFVIPLLLVGATLAAYWGVWTFDFVILDDPTYITKNYRLADGLTYENITWSFTTNYFSNWHPLTWLSYLLDAELFGIDSGPFHTTNLLLHIANTLLLYALLFCWTGAAGRSGFVAALFALHPLHVESVAWVSERKDVLSTFFGLWALLAYGWYARRRSVGWYLAALALFALSLMSKQMLVTLPFLLVLLDVWPLKRTPLTSNEQQGGEATKGADSSETSGGIICPPVPWSRLVVEKIPFFALSVVTSLIIFLVQLHTGAMRPLYTFPLTERIANAIVVYVVYLVQMVWPTRLAAFYPYPEGTESAVQTMGAALLLLAITSVAVLLRKKHWYLLVGWLWYLGTLVPVIGLVQVGDQRMADRYTYFPLIGIFIAVTWLFWHLFVSEAWHRRFLPAGALLLLVAMLGLTHQQARHWRDDELLWQHAVEVTEGNYVAHTNLGAVRLDQGQTEEAVKHWRTSLQINPDNYLAHTNLGLVSFSAGRIEEAMESWSSALRIAPNDTYALYNMGRALAKLGRKEEAVSTFRHALRVEPESTTVHTSLAKLLQDDGKFVEAIGHYLEVLRIYEKSFAVQDALTHYNVAVAYERLGQLDEAEAHYREALQWDPNYANAYFNLGNTLLARRKYLEAIAQFRKALTFSPEAASCHCNLGTALRLVDQIDEAIRHYREALRIDPQHEAARKNLEALGQSLEPDSP